MPRIVETIVTTMDAAAPSTSPRSVSSRRTTAGSIAPFKPSRTLDNLRAHPAAVASHTDDVRVFAGCLTSRRDWPTRPASHVKGAVLESAVSHWELEVARVDEDPQRPRFFCRLVHAEAHCLGRVQPGAGGGDRGGGARLAPAHAAAREDRGRARLSRHRHRQDCRTARARGLGLDHGAGRGLAPQSLVGKT